MRALVTAAIFSLLLAAFSFPASAQISRPIYLFALDTSGANNPPIHVFSVNSTTGALSEVPGSPFTVGPNPCCMVVDPTGRFVYVGNSDSNDISAFSVDASTGALTHLPGSPYLTGVDPTQMAIDSTGRFLYAYSYALANQQLYAYSIDSETGVLTSLSNSPFPAPSVVNSITADPAGNYIFFAQEVGQPILAYEVNSSSGELTPVGSFQPATRNAYKTLMVPGGEFLYSAGLGESPTDEIDAFTVSPDSGSLTEVSGSPYPVGFQPFGMTTDPVGKFLYVANYGAAYQTNFTPSQYDGSISAFTIDSESGELTTVAGSPFAAGINSFSVVVDPTGHFAYAFSSTYTTGYLDYATILAYGINPSTGALTPLPGSTWMDSIQYTGGYLLAISFGPSGTVNPIPMISSISPSSATAGTPGFTLQVNGTNFVQGATVYFGGQARATTFVNSTQLNAQISSSDIANGGTAVVYVFNPLPGGGASTSVEFSALNPSPTISSISPTSTVAGGQFGFTLTVDGSSFVTGSVVNFNGTPRSTTYVSPTELTITVSPTDIANQGMAGITVTNAANGVAGGGTSDTLTLTILPANVQPVIGALVPASATAGSSAFTLTVTGSGFTPTSVISFNLNNEPTTYISAMQLTGQIPAGAIAIAGDPVVVVTNPGAGSSLLATFVVNNPSPTGGVVSPPNLPAGSAALTLNVTGMNFTTTSTVFVNGSSRATTYVSSTLLQATLLASDLSHGGTLNITVSNPPPGGGTTSAMNLTISDYSVTPPAAPDTIAAGQPANFVLSVAPSNGTFSDPVTFSVSGLPTGTSAMFSPSATITPGSIPTNVTLTITTTAHSASSLPASPQFPALPLPISLVWIIGSCVTLGLYALPKLASLRRLAAPLVLTLLVLVAAGLTACGSSGSGSSSQQLNPNTGTPAGTYTLSVTATSGGVAHSTNVTLTVN